jgi:hypothetical protein
MTMQTKHLALLCCSLCFGGCRNYAGTVTLPPDFHGTVLISCQGQGRGGLNVRVASDGLAEAKTCPNTEIPLRVERDGKEVSASPKWYRNQHHVVMAISFEVQ